MPNQSFSFLLLKTFEVTALAIVLYSTYWENKFQALTKTVVIYEHRTVQTRTCVILFAMHFGVDCRVSFSYFFASPQTKAESMNASLSHELKAITYVSFGALQRIKMFFLFLYGQTT